jgi:GNAT superfamily N-acetyltransferase
MPTGVIVRPARAGEARLLSDLCHRSKAAWGYDGAFMAGCRDALTVGEDEIARGGVAVACRADGSVAGVVALAAGDAPGTVDLAKLFVAPGELRSGIGRILMRHAIAMASARGAQRMTILSDPNAAGFYERLGARRLTDKPSDAIPGRLLPFYEIILAS